MSRHGRTAARALGAFGVVVSIIYALQLSPAVNSACLGIVPLVSITFNLLGPRLHRSSSVAPWRLLAAASIVFLVGVLIRPWSADQSGITVGTADAFTLTGYALLIASVITMNRARGSLERYALADGLIVCLGAGLVAALLFALPAADISTRPAVISLVAGFYPLIDTVLLLLLLNLAFTTAVQLPSYRAYAFAMSALLIGDTGYAWIGRSGELSGSPLLDLPFILAYTFFGVASIHPSMAQIPTAVTQSEQPWSGRRLALIIPALLAPSVVTILVGNQSRGEGWVLAVAFAGLVGTLLVRAVSAVHSLDRIQDNLRHQARHDRLTGLANRVQLIDVITTMQTHPEPERPSVWVVFLDLDAFKSVNDSWGHATGDRLLVEVAVRLQWLAGPDVIVARVGGDEFVLSGHLTREQAVQLATLAQEALRRPIEIQELDLIVTASIGLAEAIPDQDAEALLRDADTAMYRAKGEGRDGLMIFDDSMRQNVRDTIELELALRHAIVRGQLWIAYQPIVDLESERIVGAEALLRWTHPVRGQISPVEFIPVAEETGMILDIGAWVLEQSLRQLAQWQQRAAFGPDFFLSVNASTRQLRDHHFCELAADLLAQTKVAPSQLVVEITESVMLEQSENILDVLNALRALGIRLSVDDFGTGYSSLSYLSRYPVTGVKVDRAFVSGLGAADSDEAIVRAVAALARALGLGIVAEGVETEQQRDILRKLGIGHGQGWLWGRGEAPEVFESLWAQTPQDAAQQDAAPERDAKLSSPI